MTEPEPVERLPDRLGVDVEPKLAFEVRRQTGYGPVRELVALVGRRAAREHAEELSVGLLVDLPGAAVALAVVEAAGSLVVEPLDPLVDRRVGDAVDVGDIVGGAPAGREQDHVSAHGDAADLVLGHTEELVVLGVGGGADGAVAHGRAGRGPLPTDAPTHTYTLGVR